MRTYSDGRPIYYMGDTHGIGHTMNRIAYEKLDNTIIVHCGDVGIGFNARLEANLHDIGVFDDFLLDGNVTLICCRGNHDNPEFWNNIKYREQFSNIIFAEDYEIINIGGANHIFLNGGISIDRKYRTKNLNYWENEKFILDEDKLNQIDVNIPVVISHSAPNYCYPLGCKASIVSEFARNDKTLIPELMEEREQISKAASILKTKGVKQWIYGHFHPKYTERQTIDSVEYICLPIGEVRIL